jgi:tRNA(Ile)-lysidine synthase
VPAVEVVRPILGAWRRDTEGYCRAHGLEPREDPSNRDLRYRRNRIRRELLPLLEQFEPGIKQRLVRLSRQAREEAELLNAEAAALLRSARVDSGLNAATLAAAPEALLRRAMRLAVREAGGFDVEIDAALLERLQDLVRQPAGALDLAGVRLRARRRGELLLFEAQRPERAAVPPPEPVALPGTTAAPGFGLRLVLEEGPAPRELRLPPDQALFDRDLLRPPLVLRGPERGERFRPLNAPGSTLLSDLFTNRKVPRERRRSWPVLADAEGIVWVVGLAVADRVKITPATRRVARASVLHDLKRGSC